MRDELVQIKSFGSKLLLVQVGQKTVKKVVRRWGLDLDPGCYRRSDGSQICLPASLLTGPCLVDRVANFIFSRELSTHVGSPEIFARRLRTRSGRRCVERIAKPEPFAYQLGRRVQRAGITKLPHHSPAWQYSIHMR